MQSATVAHATGIFHHERCARLLFLFQLRLPSTPPLCFATSLKGKDRIQCASLFRDLILQNSNDFTNFEIPSINAGDSEVLSHRFQATSASCRTGLRSKGDSRKLHHLLADQEVVTNDHKRQPCVKEWWLCGTRGRGLTVPHSSFPDHAREASKTVSLSRNMALRKF